MRSHLAPHDSCLQVARKEFVRSGRMTEEEANAVTNHTLKVDYAVTTDILSAFARIIPQYIAAFSSATGKYKKLSADDQQHEDEPKLELPSTFIDAILERIRVSQARIEQGGGDAPTTGCDPTYHISALLMIPVIPPQSDFMDAMNQYSQYDTLPEVYQKPVPYHKCSEAAWVEFYSKEEGSTSLCVPQFYSPSREVQVSASFYNQDIVVTVAREGFTPRPFGVFCLDVPQGITDQPWDARAWGKVDFLDQIKAMKKATTKKVFNIIFMVAYQQIMLCIEALKEQVNLLTSVVLRSPLCQKLKLTSQTCP